MKLDDCIDSDAFYVQQSYLVHSEECHPSHNSAKRIRTSLVEPNSTTSLKTATSHDSPSARLPSSASKFLRQGQKVVDMDAFASQLFEWHEKKFKDKVIYASYKVHNGMKPRFICSRNPSGCPFRILLAPLTHEAGYTVQLVSDPIHDCIPRSEVPQPHILTGYLIRQSTLEHSKSCLPV